MKYTIAKQVAAGFLLIGLLLPIFETLAENTPQIQVLALFRDKAMLKINGDRHLLKAGGKTINGVKLIRSNADFAIIEVNGDKKKYGLGSQISTRLSIPKSSVVRIPSNRGMYKTNGLINGRSVDFLVDTGASVIAMARPTADRLQIQYRETGTPMKVSTASQLHNAWHVRLNTVTVGGITLHQVDGTVIDTAHDQEILLGMSFLNRVKFSQEQGVVVLEANTQ
jgi:aspartyl protease family protein